MTDNRPTMTVVSPGVRRPEDRRCWNCAGSAERCEPCERKLRELQSTWDANHRMLAELESIADRWAVDWRAPWPGGEWGKTPVFNGLLDAIEDCGGDRRENARKFADQ